MRETVGARGMDPNHFDIHYGLDGGQSSVKLTMSITERARDERLGRARYAEVKL